MTRVDHILSRLTQHAAGLIDVNGPADPEVYTSVISASGSAAGR